MSPVLFIKAIAQGPTRATAANDRFDQTKV
jgi:hypothetical protein